MDADAGAETISGIGEKAQTLLFCSDIAAEMHEAVTDAMRRRKTAAERNAAAFRGCIAGNDMIVLYQHRGDCLALYSPRAYIETQIRQFYAEPQHDQGTLACAD